MLIYYTLTAKSVKHKTSPPITRTIKTDSPYNKTGNLLQ